MANVDLTKKPKINLTKNQVICLTKDGTNTSEKLNIIYFGASWGKIRGRDTDVDASLFCYTRNHECPEMVYYGHKHSNDGAIEHSGDDLCGGKTSNADNETIRVDLNKIDPRYQYIVAVLNVYSGEDFGKFPYITSRIYTGSAGKPDEILCSYNINKDKNFNNQYAAILGVFHRTNEGWKFKTTFLTSKAMRVINIVNDIAYKATLMIDSNTDSEPVIATQVQIANGTNVRQYQNSSNSSSNRSWFGKIIDFLSDLL